MRALLLACPVMFFAVAGLAQGPMESKLAASDGSAIDHFGGSVDIQGDLAILGARLDDDNGINSGSAYVFERDSAGNWTEHQKLLASDGVTEERFGRSVAIDGDYMLIGAHLAMSGRGAVYVFHRNGDLWAEEAKLVANDPDTLDFFGFDVDISGDVAIIGAHGDDEAGDSAGAAYIFRRSDTVWTLELKLMPTDATPDDRFGRSVSVSGPFVAVGAIGDDDNGSASGSAYVYNYNGTNWTFRQKLLASNGTGSDNFGTSIGLNGDDLIVGARFAQPAITGAAYIFRRSIVWNEIAVLVASDPEPFDEFGVSVDIAGGVAIVGASQKGDSTGAAYVYEELGGVWTEKNKLTSSEAQAGDEFGREVAISSLDAIAGALGAEGNVPLSGAAFVYRDITTDVDDTPVGPTLPVSLKLNQNFPNPFNPSTSISYDLVSGANVELTIHNLLGQPVRTLVHAYQSAGTHSAQWDGKNASGKEVAGGIYLYRLTAGDQVLTRKMVFLK